MLHCSLSCVREATGTCSGLPAHLGNLHPLVPEHSWFLTPPLSLQNETGGRTAPQVRSPTCRDPKVSVHPSMHRCPAAPDYGMGQSPLFFLPSCGISYRGDWAFSLIYLGSRNTLKSRWEVIPFPPCRDLWDVTSPLFGFVDMSKNSLGSISSVRLCGGQAGL